MCKRSLRGGKFTKEGVSQGRKLTKEGVMCFIFTKYRLKDSQQRIHELMLQIMIRVDRNVILKNIDRILKKNSIEDINKGERKQRINSVLLKRTLSRAC